MVSRYPDEADVGYLITQLRRNHVFVHFIAKATPSAGTNSKAFFDIASATNGVCIFGDGEDFFDSGCYGTYIIEKPFQVISQNYVVSGSGRIEMPVFLIPNGDRSWDYALTVITVQDHPLDNNVFLNYTISSDDGTYYWNGQTRWGQHGTGIIDELGVNAATYYNWTIVYSYPDNKLQRIEARLYTDYYNDFLPLPPI